MNRRVFLKISGLGAAAFWLPPFAVSKERRITQPNIIIILTDDHRYDALGFLGHPFLETPNLDRLAREGIFCQNAFVTTSLCSPSRASILTGLYAHNHKVVDNYNPVPSGVTFFPQFLQQAGYETAFIGKWHMGGEIDDPQPGFDYWLSFKGQGTYWADGHGTSRVVPQTSSEGFNINGKRVPQRGYITDELTDYTINWLKNRENRQPYLLFLSHKAVHSDFVAADRHLGRYGDKKMPLPKTYPDTPENYNNKPMWLKNQRNSRHGVDYAYNLERFDLNKYYQRYTETLLSVDESVGRIIDFLEKKGGLNSTVILYMGDNGFQFGEHGLIDKRTAYEASIRIPLLIRCPELFKSGIVVKSLVANIDIAPTIMDMAGIESPDYMDGRSFLALLRGEENNWRDALLYEYFWERNYPQTPTIHAIRTEKYKYIRYHGIWDIDELYDIENDPDESKNLIHDAGYKEVAESLHSRLVELLKESKGDSLPLLPDRGATFPWRKPDGSVQGKFPDYFFNKP
jgi:N-acetylglucosamine-6-sulfatase